MDDNKLKKRLKELITKYEADYDEAYDKDPHEDGNCWHKGKQEAIEDLLKEVEEGKFNE